MVSQSTVAGFTGLGQELLEDAFNDHNHQSENLRCMANICCCFFLFLLCSQSSEPQSYLYRMFLTPVSVARWSFFS